MPKTNYLGIKLMSIKFYSLKDCKPGQSFTAVVHNGSTIYKSGLLMPSKKYLDLSELSQIQFIAIARDGNPQLSFKLISFPQDSVTDNQISNYKQFSCKIPVMEVVGKKNIRSKVCTYPLLHQTQIKAELQFKVRSKPKDLSSEDIFNQIQIIPVKNEQNKQNLMTENKKVKAVISQIRILITPDMFVKNKRNSTEDMSYEYLNVGEQNFTPSPKSQKLSERQPDNRNKLSEQNCDLITKFEFLNKRFETEDGENGHQKSSVWQQEQFECFQKDKEKGLLTYNQFQTIHEENQSQRSSS